MNTDWHSFPVGTEQKPWTRWWWPGSAVDESNVTREVEALAAAGFGGVEITPIYGVPNAAERHVEFLSDRWLAPLLHACREARRLGLGVDIVPGTGWRLGGPSVPAAQRAVKRGFQNGTLFAEPSGEQVKRAGPGGAGDVIDVLNAQALRDYFEGFNDRVTAMVPPDLVRAQFHDSWEYETDWTHAFENEFRKRRGYSLEEWSSVFDPHAPMDEQTRARVYCDYLQTMDELVLDHFCGTWDRACSRRGWRTRNQAHGCFANILDMYASADIPETETFRDRVDPLINKFASSAGHVAGRRLVSAESFTWLSDHWCSDLGKMKRTADHLFLSGINHIVYHGTCYSPDDVAWPGWLFYASVQCNDRNPLWAHWPALNAYVARCQAVLQAGAPDNDVLVYWPVPDVYMHAGGELPRFRINGDKWSFGAALKDAASELWHSGYLFDYISDRQLGAAAADSGDVHVSDYRAIVIPEAAYMPVSTVRALAQLAGRGTHIVCCNDPYGWDVPGLHEADRRREALQAAVRKLTGLPACRVVGRLERDMRGIGCAREVLQSNTGLRCARRRLGENEVLYFIVNRGNETVDRMLNPAVMQAAATLFDPWTGRAGRTELNADGGVRLQLEPGESVVLRLGDEPRTAETWEYRPEPGGACQRLDGEWTVSFIAGGPTLPPPFAVTALGPLAAMGDPELERFAGTVRYEARLDRGLPGLFRPSISGMCGTARASF